LVWIIIDCISNSNKEETTVSENSGLVTGYLELTEYPDFPPQETPAKEDCEGYQFISMKQMCNITQAHGRHRSPACDDFGGDNGDIPVQPDRQTWKWKKPGHRIKKFVLVRAVENYFRAIGIDW
jgi:hypothetical protein